MSIEEGTIAVSVSFFGIIVILFLAFFAVKALSSIFGHLNAGRGWVAVCAILALFAIGMAFFGMVTVRSHRVITGEEIAVANQPLVIHQDPRVIDSSPLLVNELPRLHGAPAIEAIGAAPDAQPQQSIEEMWKQLTAPRINLDETVVQESVDVVDEALGPSSPRELHAAAKVILSASVPGADPFTQGWLINAAKAIVKATPNVQVEGKSPPDWVSNPQNVVGSTISTDSTQMKYVRRVVSTDALKTLEECRDQLEKRLRFAVGEQVRALSKQATGRAVINGGPMLAEMGVTPEYILRELCPEGTYVETVKGSDGETLRAYALLEFTPPNEQALLERWQAAMRAKGFGADDIGLATTEATPLEVSTPGERPDWLVNPPKQVGNVRRIVVVSGPFSTVEECQRDLDGKMYDIVLNRMNDISQNSLTRRTGAARLDDMGLGGDYIRRELCTDEFVDTIDSSVGEMKQVYALLEFNESQDAMLIDRARSYSRQEGLQDVSLIGGGLLASVATLFGLLKVDTWTRGYYTKRLFLGVPAAIITVLALLTS